jgi:GTPase-activating protein SAC7
LSGSEKRIKELKLAFDSPDRYGKGLVWDGYTVHDAANVLRRYLNDLPEPVVPLDLYERFREPLRGHTKQAVGDTEGTQLVDNFNEAQAIEKYQDLIKILPPLNRQLLLYILDLLAVFAAKADENRMTAQNLAAIFQPGMLSHPNHAMAPEEYRLNQCVIIFLIENQDHFLIGMQGTAADEKTKQDIEKGTPVIIAPTTPSKSRSSGPVRTASNASAGAESVSRDGKIRRNRSTSSRHSRHSNGASTPGSPALATTPIVTSGGGLGRSNTVPSKKSPHMPSGRFQRQDTSPSAAAAPASPSPMTANAAGPPTVIEEPKRATEESSGPPDALQPAAPVPVLASTPDPVHKSQERLPDPASETATPSRERIVQNLFNLSPSEAEKRQPNKLRKKRIPGSANPSAHSSTASLTHSGAVSPSFETSNPFDKSTHLEPTVPEHPPTETPSEATPTASAVPSASTLQTAQPDASRSLKPKESIPTSLHSSFNEGSDLDQTDDNIAVPSGEQQDKDRKRRWRLSRRKDDIPSAHGAHNLNLGINSHAEASTSSIGSGGKPRKSWTGDSSDVAATLAESEQVRERDESRGPLGWIKTKYREAKETADQKRTKSPPEEHSHHGFLPRRGKSIDIKRGHDERQAQPQDSNHEPHNVPLPMSPPPVPTTHEERSKAT